MFDFEYSRKMFQTVRLHHNASMKWLRNTEYKNVHLTPFSVPINFVKILNRDCENLIFSYNYFHYKFWTIFHFERFFQESIDFFETFPWHAWQCQKLNSKVLSSLIHWNRSKCNDKNGARPKEGARVLPKKMGRGVRPPFQNPYPIYDQNLLFSLPYL